MDGSGRRTKRERDGSRGSSVEVLMRERAGRGVSRYCGIWVGECVGTAGVVVVLVSVVTAESGGVSCAHAGRLNAGACLGI
jgi:hypothetical protein